MIKKISYMLIAFTFSFLCFVSSVNAVVDYSQMSVFESFSDEFLNDLDNLFTTYALNNPGSINACVYHYSKFQGNYAFDCGYFDFNSNISFNAVNDPRYISNGSVRFLSSSLEDISNYRSVVSSIPNPTMYFFTDFYSPIFWTLDDVVYNGTTEFKISDENYSLISDDLKTKYNFQNYLVNGQPFYSIINLRLGNWKGYTGNIDLVYCVDSVCEESPNKLLEYKYSVDNEIVDLSDMLDSEYNGYLLDSTKTYAINANVATELKVYYYSTEVDYTINYYYDDVLQESLTEVKKGNVNSVVTLTNLDEVKENIYFLDKEDVYSITLSDSEENVINVYYYSKDVAYSVNVYLDDIFYQSHSYTSIGKVGSEIILEDLVETINIYTLDEREYKVLLSENQETNYINVYYYSENYDTKYQDIDTSDKFYIAFDWVYIKDLFSLNGLYTQTEQFVIVYVVNFLFYAIVCIFGYFGLKMINKLFSLFKMF